MTAHSTIERGRGRMLSARDVARETSLHRATIYRKQAEGTFPRSRPISRGRVAWDEAEIARWKADPMNWRAEVPDG